MQSTDKKFRSGGFTNASKGKFNKPRPNRGMMQLPNVSLEKFVGRKTGGTLNEKEKDMKKMNPGMMAMMAKKKPAKKMAAGGMPMVMKDGKKVPAFAADGKGKMAKGGMTKMAKGGGIEIKGKTKGTMIGMKKGGGC